MAIEGDERFSLDLDESADSALLLENVSSGTFCATECEEEGKGHLVNNSRPHFGRYHGHPLLIYQGGILVLSLMVAALLLKTAIVTNHSPCFTQRQEDINHIGPSVSSRIVVFMNDSSWVPSEDSSVSMNDTYDKWISLVPRGLGFITVDHLNRYDLPIPIANDQGGGVFVPSIFHQLHCLFMVMEDWHHLATNEVSPHQSRRWLIRHCFDYLRQSILCSADTSLEGHETTYPGNVASADGWHVKHVCKDYDEVFNWFEDHRLNDRRAW